MSSLFSSSAGTGPPMTWEAPMSYPAIKGLAMYTNNTFAHFSSPCGETKRDLILMTNPKYGDAIHPAQLSNIKLFNVDEESKVRYQKYVLQKMVQQVS